MNFEGIRNFSHKEFSHNIITKPKDLKVKSSWVQTYEHKVIYFNILRVRWLNDTFIIFKTVISPINIHLIK